MNKRCLSFVLALVMILTMVPMTAVAASADRFTDVTKDKWYYTFVDYVAEKGYFSGTSETKFSPDVTMTRAMFVTALANMESVTADNSKTAFTDVPAGKWYTGAAKWAVDNKILSGYSDGTFRPNAKITREEMCVIMSNYIAYHSEKNNVEHKKEGSTKAFSDASQISSWAKTAVADCRAYGLIDGFSDGTFRPKKESTRAEVAAVIYKLAWLVKEEPTTGGGGGGGGSTTDYGPYRLAVTANISATLNNTFTRDPNGAVDYEMDDKVIDVMRRFNAENRTTYITAFNQAINEAKDRGALKADGTVKYVGVPTDAAASGEGVTQQVVSEVKATIKADAAVRTALTTAGVTDTNAYVENVIDALVSGEGLDIASMSMEEAKKQLVVVKALNTKITDVTVTKIENVLNQPGYEDYKNLVDNMGVNLTDTLESYKTQLASIKDKLERAAGVSTFSATNPIPASDIYYLKQKYGKLQTYVVVDPLEVMDQQYDARKNNVLARVQATTDVNDWLDCSDPANLFDGRKVKTAEQYYTIMVDQMEHMYNMSKTWQPTDFYGDPNRETSIDGMITAICNRGGSMADNMTQQKKDIIKAMFGDQAKTENGKGFDMTMKEFFEDVMHKDVNLRVRPADNDASLDTTVFNFTFDPSDFTGAGTGSAVVERALSWFNDVYPNAIFTINAIVDWEKPDNN